MKKLMYFGDVTPVSREPRTCWAEVDDDGTATTYNFDLGKRVGVDPTILRETEEEASDDARRMAGQTK